MEKEKKPTTVNVQALPAKKGKPQHMEPGKVYEVTPEMAKVLIDAKFAVKIDKAPGTIQKQPKEKGSDIEE